VTLGYAAQRCFARQGFHETSMQDVFRESGLSAGAVYRYFKGKDEITREIAASTFGQISVVAENALNEEPTPGLDEIAVRVATAVQELSGPDGPARVGPAAWAVALHDPEVAAIVRDVLDKLRMWWVRAVRRVVDEGRLPSAQMPRPPGPRCSPGSWCST
jgi:TetR/AcrR family transcriptional regulator, transcriptional repressor of aconitase